MATETINANMTVRPKSCVDRINIYLPPAAVNQIVLYDFNGREIGYFDCTTKTYIPTE